MSINSGGDSSKNVRCSRTDEPIEVETRVQGGVRVYLLSSCEQRTTKRGITYCKYLEACCAYGQHSGAILKEFFHD